MSALKRWFSFRFWNGLARCRLCRQVTGAVFVAILLVEGAILIFSVRSFERDRILEIEREGLAVVRSWMDISGDQPDTLGKMAPMIGGDSVLVGATVFDSTGTKIAKLRTSDYSQLHDKEKRRISWQPDKTMSPYRVDAILNVSEIPGQVNGFIWRIIGLVLLISVFVTMVTMVILEKLLLAPIRDLRAHMTNACIDLSASHLNRVEHFRDDELGDAVRAYNNLLSRLDGAFDEIRKQQTDLEKSNEELERQVSARTGELNKLVHDLRREAAARERMERALEGTTEGLSEKVGYSDTLTGLSNRELFWDRLNHVFAQSKQSHGKTALHMIDLDGFKRVNDMYGNQIGDAVLQNMADRLRELTTKADTLARLSADEFALIQADVVDVDRAAVLAEQVVERLSEPLSLKGQDIELDVSIGIALLPGEGESSEDVFKHAGLALRKAKKEEGSAYQFFETSMNEEAQERQAIERDLKKAILNDELEVYYQPKLDLKTGTISGMEALVRWHHPERGFMSPGLFIPVAERSRLIVQLGDWVMRSACRQIRRWQAAGVGRYKIAVNVSAVQLKDKGLVDSVRKTLLETGLDPELLEIEITESAVMSDVEQTIQVLHDLRDLGVSLSIDDFGTGYSSLNYLKRFPVKRIKIDKAFVDEIETLTSDGAIARAVITLGHSLGLEITAEGVEHAEQLEFLKQQDCDEIQGYHFGKPMNARDFEQFVSGMSARRAA